MLALLDVGPTEFLLVAGLFLVLFGADKLPALAREIGQASARLRGASSQFQRQWEREQGLDRPGDAVPPDAKAQLREAERAELARLQRAAGDLGIDIAGKDEAQLRAAIAERVAPR